MKMWAVFDKDVKQVTDAGNEKDALWAFLWANVMNSGVYVAQDTYGEFLNWAASEGYTIQPVVVMREEVYNEVVSYVNRIIDNTGHDPDYAMDATSETYKQFIKAGE